MDYSKLTGVPAAIDEALETFEFPVPEIEISGKLVKPTNGMGEPLKLTMHPGSGTRWKRAVRKVHVKAARANSGADKGDDADAVNELTEEELDAELRTQDSRTCELLARLCDGWNMTDGKKPIECTVDAVADLFKQIEPIREAVDRAITKRGNELKAKKSA